MANRTSHRYNRLPLLPSGPGGVQQELVVPICRSKDIESLAVVGRRVEIVCEMSNWMRESLVRSRQVPVLAEVNPMKHLCSEMCLTIDLLNVGPNPYNLCLKVY